MNVSNGLQAWKDKHETPAYHTIPSALPERAVQGPVISDTMVAMRDGVKLATDVYLPAR